MPAFVIAGVITSAFGLPPSTPVVPNPTGTIWDTPASQVAFYKQQVSTGQQTLRALDAKIKSIQRQIPEAERDYADALTQLQAKATEVERLAYEAVQKYQVNADQTFTAIHYALGLAVCQKYLETYPNGEYAAAVRQQSVELQQEKEQVEKGLVKFEGRWMSESQKAAVLEQEAQLQAEKTRQAFVQQEQEAQLQAEKTRQALAEQEREAQRQHDKELWSELGKITLSVFVLASLVGGFAVSLRVGARLAKIENVTSRTVLLASVTSLVSLIVIFLCSIPLGRLALITPLVMGVVATSFIVKAIFRATWEKALLTNIFALTATAVGMVLLFYFLIFLGVSNSILDMVKPR